MIWLTKNASNPTYEMIQENEWSLQSPSATSTPNNEGQESTVLKEIAIKHHKPFPCKIPRYKNQCSCWENLYYQHSEKE